MWYGSDGGSWVVWLVMSLMMLAFWGGLIALVVWLVRSPRGQDNDKTSPDKSPYTILEERFARGEIDEDEFRKRRDALLQLSGKNKLAAVRQLSEAAPTVAPSFPGSPRSFPPRSAYIGRTKRGGRTPSNA